MVPDGDKSVWLRMLAKDSAPLNGAQVSKGDEVCILDKTTVDDTEWMWIKVGRKKGWLRAEYVA